MTAFSNGPWVGSSKFVHQGQNQNRDHLVRVLVNCAEDCWVKKCVVDDLVVEAGTKYSQGGCMFVLTVEYSPLDVGFQRLNGGAGDVLGDVGSVSGPKDLSQVSTLGW